MKIILTEEKRNTSSNQNRSQYYDIEDPQGVRKICNWAVITCPYKTGHMAFSTVSGYNEWKREERIGHV